MSWDLEKVGDKHEHFSEFEIVEVNLHIDPARGKRTYHGNLILEPPRTIWYEDAEGNRIHDHVRMTIRCDCGRGDVYLSNGLSNYCPECGRNYNMSGQPVQDHYHYEDTGEYHSDVVLGTGYDDW